MSHVGFAVALGLIAAVAFWRYGPDWLESFGNFSGQLRRTTSVSTARWLEAIGLSEDAAVAVLTVLFVAGYLWLLREAWRGRARLALCGLLPPPDRLLARSVVRGLGSAARRDRA